MSSYLEFMIQLIISIKQGPLSSRKHFYEIVQVPLKSLNLYEIILLKEMETYFQEIF